MELHVVFEADAEGDGEAYLGVPRPMFSESVEGGGRVARVYYVQALLSLTQVNRAIPRLFLSPEEIV